MRKLRAAWVVHSPVGLVVIPARCTRLDPISMMKRAWYRRNSAVSTHAKSVAMIAAAWDRMNSIQVGPVRSRAGSIPADLRIFHTVDAAMVWPSRVSSPWIRRYPQFGFSPASRMTSFRISGSIGGRPRWAPAVEHPGKHGEDRPVGFGELCSSDLALEHEQLVTQREDLGVAPVTGGEHPSEA